MQQIAALILMFVLLTQTVLAGTNTYTYEVPDVRDVFCGVEIHNRYCECAFYNDQCNSVFMDSSQAWNFVLREFRNWNKSYIQAMAESCLVEGGYWDKSDWSCTTCTEGDVLEGASCVSSTPERDAVVAECKEVGERFVENWQGYSDFDEQILINEASHEVQQYHQLVDEITNLTTERIELLAEMEFERHYQNELRAYKAALVQGVKEQLPQALWRISYITLQTNEGGRGGAEVFLEAMYSDSVPKDFSSGLKSIQAHVPSHETQMQFSTDVISRQVGSIVWSGSFEAFESLGDPKVVAAQFVQDVREAAIGGPDIPDESVATLRAQQLDNEVIERALAKSAEKVTSIRLRVRTIESLVAEKYNQAQEWKAREYQRAQRAFTNQCQHYE